MSESLLVPNPFEELRPKWRDAPGDFIKIEKLLHDDDLQRCSFVPIRRNLNKSGTHISYVGILRQVSNDAAMEKSIHSPAQHALQELLRQIRLGAGLRQSDLARRLGQPQSFVSKYESGERRLDLLEIRQICQAVGLSLTQFADRFEKAVDDS